MIQSIYIPEVYTGNGLQTAYAFTWRILSTADLLVRRENLTTGVITTLTLGTDFTVPSTAIDKEEGDTITLATALAVTEKLYIDRHTDRTQLNDYRNGTPFDAASLTRALDRLTMIDQELESMQGSGQVGESSGNIITGTRSVTGNAESLAVGFASAMSNALYTVLFVNCNWHATAIVPAATQTATGFTAVFSNPALAAGGRIFYGIKP